MILASTPHGPRWTSREGGARACGPSSTRSPPRPSTTQARAKARELLEGWAKTQRTFNSLGDGQASSPSWRPVDALLETPTAPLEYWDGLAARGLEVQTYETTAFSCRPSPFAAGRLYLHFQDPSTKTLPAILGAATGRILGTASASIRSVAVPGSDREQDPAFPGVLKFSAPWLGADRIVDQPEIDTIAAFNAHLAIHGGEVLKYFMPDTAAILVRFDEGSTAVLHRPLPLDLTRSGIQPEAFLSGVVLADPGYWASDAARALSELIPGAQTVEKAQWIARQIAPQLAKVLAFGLDHGFIPGVAHLQNVNVFFYREASGRPAAEIKYQDFYTYMTDDLLAFAASSPCEGGAPSLPRGQVNAESLAARSRRPAQGVERAIEVGFDRWMNALTRLGGPTVRDIFFGAFVSELERWVETHHVSSALVLEAASRPSRPYARGRSHGLGSLVSRVRDAVVGTKLRARVEDERWTRVFEALPYDTSTTPPRRPSHTGLRFDRLVEILTDRRHHARVTGGASTYALTPGVIDAFASDTPFLRGILSGYAVHRDGDRILFMGSDRDDLFMLQLTEDEARELDETHG